jgi:hypothetical protein
MPNGMGYVFPKDDTVLHIFHFGRRPWEDPYELPEWNALNIPNTLMVNELICNTEKKFGTGKLRMTELYPRGQGLWDKRTSFVRDGPNTGKTLQEVGWGSQGKDGKPPIWIGLELA